MTQPLTFGPWPAGLDNVSKDTTLQPGTVRDAVNVDFDRSGGAARRGGHALQLAVSAHSLWTAASGQTYGVVNGGVCTIEATAGSVTYQAIYPLTRDGRVSFDNLLDGVVFSGPRDLCFIDPEGEVRQLGVENPSSPTVTPTPYGGMAAGRYAVGMTYLRRQEESGMAYGAALAEVEFGGGLTLDIPQPADPEIDGVRIYLTPPNGDVYYRAADLPIGMLSFFMGHVNLGRKCDTQFLERLLPGSIVRAWKGRVLVAVDNVLTFSQPMRYGLFDRRHDWTMFTSAITLLQPVESGVFVGNEQGVFFLRGTNPAEWQMEITGGKPPIANTGLMVEASELGIDTKQQLALWLARNGFVIGNPDGSIIETQKSRIRIPPEQWAGTGAAIVTDRKVIASIG